MKTLKRFLRYICCAAALFSTSCTSDPQVQTEQALEMPQNHPKTAVESYQKLASFIPVDSDILAISSYGTIADAIVQIKNWNLVDGDAFQKLLNDLGTHYLLNPADLKTYFKAGFNTASGFAFGIKENSPYLIFDIHHHELFRRWFDNFLNEEFGRPHYHELAEGSKKITQIRILNQDFATLVEEPNKPVIITLGPGLMATSRPSLVAYHAFDAGNHMDDDLNLHQHWMASLRDAPIAIWTKSEALNLKSIRLPKDLQDLYPWTSGIGFALYFSANGPKMRAFFQWRTRQFKGIPLGNWVTALTNGSSGPWAKTILNTQPSSMARVLIHTEELEPLVLSTLTNKQQNLYAELKDKLTQRLLKLNVSEQVIYNMGAAWAVLYEPHTPTNPQANLIETLTAQDAAIFIPMRDAAASDAFFAKVNILKGFVPKNLGTVELEGDLLHAQWKGHNDLTLHMAYRQGLIALSADKGWTRVQKVFASTEAPANDSLFALDSHFFAMKLKKSDIMTILGSRLGMIDAQIGEFLKPFELVEMHASANASSFEVVVEAPLAKSVQ